MLRLDILYRPGPSWKKPGQQYPCFGIDIDHLRADGNFMSGPHYRGFVRSIKSQDVGFFSIETQHIVRILIRDPESPVCEAALQFLYGSDRRVPSRHHG